MKLLKHSTVLLACLIIFAASPSFARKFVYDPGCDCYVPDYTTPDIQEPPEDPPPERVGRCQSGPPGLNGNPPGIEDVRKETYEIDPCEIATGCKNPEKHKHLVYVSESLKTADNLREKLVVVLPGNGQDPANIRWLLRSAAFAGFRTIGLTYRGKKLRDVQQICPSLFEYLSDCTNRFRAEVLYGGREIKIVDSIRQRFVDLLEDLDRRDPNGGWGAYLKGTASSRDLRYKKIIMSGFSLGSGHAAYWAKDEEFGGLVTFAGPTDHASFPLQPRDPRDVSGSSVTILADWILGTHATPGGRRAALLHVGEGQQKLEVIGKAWDAFGLSQRAPKDLTHAWDVIQGRLPGGQPAHDYLPWPYISQEQRFTIDTQFDPNKCTAHQATAANACVADDMNTRAEVPRAFGAYLHLFCSI